MMISRNFVSMRLAHLLMKVPFSLTGMKENGISADDEQIYWNGEPYV